MSDADTLIGESDQHVCLDTETGALFIPRACRRIEDPDERIAVLVFEIFRSARRRNR